MKRADLNAVEPEIITGWISGNWKPPLERRGNILYRGSRDELNEMCRVKDERIAQLEAMATEMVYAIPGGSICDPQQVSDALREIAAKHGVMVKDE